MKRIQTTNKYVLLPVEESENLAHIRVIKDNNVVKEFNCKLAVNKVDYSVPLDVSEFGGDVLLDIQFTGEKKNPPFHLLEGIERNQFFRHFQS